jgi:hypothetical protein
MQKEPERKKFEIYLYAPYNRPLEQTVIIFHSIITFPSLAGRKTMGFGERLFAYISRYVCPRFGERFNFISMMMKLREH